MVLSELISRTVRAALALMILIVADYMLLDGLMTQYSLAGLQNLVAELPLMFERILDAFSSMRYRWSPI
jgi:hypothetical protein